MTYSHKSPMHKLLASAGAVSIVAADEASYRGGLGLKGGQTSGGKGQDQSLPRGQVRVFPRNLAGRGRILAEVAQMIQHSPYHRPMHADRRRFMLG